MKIFNDVKAFVMKQTTKASIALTKKSPTLLLTGGIGCIIAATVYGIAQASKADAVMDEFNKNIENIHDTIKRAEETGEPEKYYPVKTQVENKRLVYGHMIMSMAKIYLPVAALEAIGIYMICKSHKILTKRNASLAAAYAAQTKMFSEYRKRVKDRLGEQAEHDIYYGTQTVEFVEKETSENGVTTEVTKSKIVEAPLDSFAFYIGIDDNPWGFKDPYSIMNQLQFVEFDINNQLCHGNFMSPKDRVVFMNEVARRCGVPERIEWNTFYCPYDSKDPEHSFNLGLRWGSSNELGHGYIEGSQEYNFVNRLSEGVWVRPNITRNICDDPDIDSKIKRLNEETKK